jgi:hypothetical protein
VICTDGGWVPESAQWPQATVYVLVGEIRAIDFVADNTGDWAFHCHKSHSPKLNSRPSREWPVRRHKNPEGAMILNSDRGHYVSFAVAHGAAERKRPSPS